MLQNLKRSIMLAGMALSLFACGFHPQGQTQLAKPLHKLHINSLRPYGYLTRYLETYLATSSVHLTPDESTADTILVISQDDTSQELTGVSGTQQTRQYNIHVNVTFEITDNHGRTLVAPQTLTETRSITIQSNQILGSSNEANLYYQQMRRTLAYAIINRLSSRAVTKEINTAYTPNDGQKAR